MNRRQFLSSLAAFALAPAVRLPAFAGAASAPVASAAVPAATYKWAETIVRAHNKCNLGMLQRLLALDPATAAALKSELLKNGVISTAKNAYGMHTAVKPLYTEVFPQVKSATEKLADSVGEKIEELLDEETDEDDIDETAEANDPTIDEVSLQSDEDPQDPENTVTKPDPREES